ncbi:TonB-dependent receptor [Arundinibacter roseus]|uniref:SusC/RagA family TonB-linked outer membrane protein n=1 Tax=Arundinibacter roseus TaxID=2070510 RepID=A0A4R4KIG6_9BACT|nr:TonB-dependent receptor [Arundinibacter roseus]TDB67908.1 SusC/RagA family TonB-linked outer membrane protein [Arundinibacter roseus]
MKKHATRQFWVELMKFTLAQGLVMLVMAGISYALPTKAQEYLDKRLSLKVYNQEIKTVLTDIEKATDVRFVYSSQVVGSSLRVSIQKTNVTLGEILDNLLKPLKISYELEGRKIILSPAQSASPRQSSWVEEIRVTVPKQILNGKVVDETGTGLPGVSVVIKGTTRGTTTNGEGAFQLDVPSPESVLVLSFVGYVSQELVVGNRSTLEIAMVPEDKSLDELVVVGYGTQKKVNLTGSVATIDAKFLADRPITNSSQALQGLPGVFVNMNKGRPGADGASITIRGANSYFSGSAPLVLVDGIEFPLSDVNPNDIESITVLKDAASAAIYGSRAQNGVVLVKTKSGQRNKKMTVDYNGYYGVQTVSRLPQNVVWNSLEYMEGKNRALANEGRQPEYSQALMDEYRAGTDPFIYANTNWFDIMFNPAPIQQHNVRLAGGSDKTAYSLSLGFMDQKGIMPNTNANRYTLSTSIDSDVTPWLKIGSSLLGTFSQDRESAYSADEGNGEGGIMGLTYRGLPMQTAIAADGSYADQWIRVPGHNFFRNPYALSFEGDRLNKQLRTILNLYAQVNLPLGIIYKITAAPNVSFSSEKYNYPVILLTHPKTGDRVPMGNIPARGVRQGGFETFNFTNFQTLNWEKTLAERHYLNLLVGTSVEYFYNSNFSAQNQGYLGNEITELSGGTINPLVSGSSARSRIMSYFGRVNYVLNDKYLFESNFRFDGSSRFAPENRWGFFPSVSVGWRINEENFLKDVRAISNLKLRASWGQLGNQNIPLFSYINGITLGTNYNFNNALVSGAAITQLADPNVSWETTTTSNIGLDGGFFNNTLTFEVDLFSKFTDGILARVNLPSQVGNLGGPLRNIGSVSNKGVELTLGYRNRIGQLNYNVGANVTYLKNLVENTNGEIIFADGGMRITQEGQPLNSFFGLEAIGIFQSTEEITNAPFQNRVLNPGDLRYKDQNNDGIIDNNDRVVIGRSVPRYTYSFTAGGDFKAFDLAIFFQGVEGINTNVTSNLAQPYKNGAGVTRDWLTDSWTPENPNAPLPRLTTATGYPQNFVFSDFWLQDLSYLRLKNIQLGYTLPATAIKKVGLSKLRVFVNGQNLLTFTKFRDGDPERDANQRGIIAYPIAKIVSGGITATF